MSKNKRFSTMSSYLGMYTIFDDKKGEPLNSRKVLKLLEENKQLKEEFDELKRENRELNELCGKYVIKIGRLEKENEELKQSKEDKNCHNCKNCNTYDEGEGYGYVSLCDKDCMNTDGYFDYEYHGFKQPCTCPFWEDDEYD